MAPCGRFSTPDVPSNFRKSGKWVFLHCTFWHLEGAQGAKKIEIFFFLVKFRLFPFRIRADRLSSPRTQFSSPGWSLSTFGHFWGFHHRGYSELLGNPSLRGRKLPRGGQTRLGMCSPDAQDNKKCWVGYPAGTCVGVLAPNQKLADRFDRPQKVDFLHRKSYIHFGGKRKFKIMKILKRSRNFKNW